MKEIRFELKSICPLKMDRWVDGTQPKTKEGYIKQAKKKAYRDEEGNLCIPARALKAATKLAASELVGVRKGKAMRQTIQAYLVITPTELPLGKKDYDEIVTDIVTRKGTGDKVTRVVTYRPLIKEWGTQGTISLFGDELSSSFARQSLDLAGLKYGLLSHRPEFGRFVVTKFEEVKTK